MAFNAWALLPLAALVSTSTLGLYLLCRDRRSRVKRAFLHLMAFLALWDIGELMMRTVYDPESALFWAKFIYLGGLFVAPAYASFVFRLAEKKFNAALLYLSFAMFLVSLPTDLFIRGVTPQFWGYSVDYGVLFPLFGAALLLTLLYAWGILWRARSEVEDLLARKKLGIMLYFSIAPISFGGITDIVFPALGIHVIALASPMIAATTLAIAYAFQLKK